MNDDISKKTLGQSMTQSQKMRPEEKKGCKSELSINEEVLRTKERQLTDIIEFLPDATLAIDTNGNVILWNKAIEKMTGIPAAEMIGKGNYAYAIPFYGEMHPVLLNFIIQDDEEIANRYINVNRIEDSLTAEVFCPALNNNKGAWILAKASPLHDQAGNMTGAIESMRDITEVKNANIEKEKWTAELIRANNGLAFLKNNLELIVKKRVAELVAANKELTFQKEEKEKRVKELVRAEKALRSKERQLTDIIEFLPDATLAIDTTGHVIIWNKAIEKMTGISATEMIGKGDYAYSIPLYGEAHPILLNLAYPSDMNIPDRYIDVNREGEAFTAEVFCSALNNNKGAWVFAKSSPLHDQAGNVIGAIESIRDITEAKNAEEALRSKEKQLTDIIKFLPDATAAIDVTGHVILWNEAIEKMTGIPATEMIGKGDYIYSIPYYGEARPALLDLVFLSNEEIETRYPNLSREGDTLITEVYCPALYNNNGAWILAKASPLHDQAGNMIGAIESLRDITATKNAEEALRSNQRQLTDIIEFLPDATLAVDTTGHIILWNEANEKMTGIPAAEMIGKGDYAYAVPYYGEAHPTLLDLVFQKDEEIETRYPNLTHEGDALITEEYCPALYNNKGAWILAKASPLHDQAGNMIGAIESLRDITKTKNTEEEKEKRAAELIIANKELIFQIAEKEKRASELTEANNYLKTSLINFKKLTEAVIGAITIIVEKRDPYTAGHQLRVSKLACAIAKEMGLDESLIEGIRIAGLMHDVGKIAIPSEILSKPGRISEAEFELIKVHPKASYEILKDIEFSRPIADIVLQHHERLDGSGYPNGLKGVEISMDARILNVSDVVEAMSSYRPYRPALGLDQALIEIQEHKGTWYDTIVVDTCTRLFTDKIFEF